MNRRVVDRKPFVSFPFPALLTEVESLIPEKKSTFFWSYVIDA